MMKIWLVQVEVIAFEKENIIPIRRDRPLGHTDAHAGKERGAGGTPEAAQTTE